MDCIFCKIAKEETPCYKVYENKKFIGFLSINPLNPGHTLVIPKEHFRWVWDITYIDEYYKVVRKIANAVRKAMNTEFLASVTVGEEVPHAHVWLIPRFENDGHGGAINFENTKKINSQKIKEIANKIKNELKP